MAIPYTTAPSTWNKYNCPTSHIAGSGDCVWTGTGLGGDATALTTLPLNSLVVYNSYLAKMMAIDGVSLTNGVINILTTADGVTWSSIYTGAFPQVPLNNCETLHHATVFDAATSSDVTVGRYFTITATMWLTPSTRSIVSIPVALN